MSGYSTHIRTLRIGGQDLRIRALVDTQQFADPDRAAARMGISSAQWSLFGHVWPAGRMLAEVMSGFAVEGKRILEIGCGLGLASLVLQRRRADISASDHHPLAEVFLAYNAALNDLPAVTYRQLRWQVPDASFGRFDLVIGSDLLYERGQGEAIVALLERHLQPHAEVLITDPGRGNSAAFSRALCAQGFSVEGTRGPMDDGDVPPFRGRLLHYRR